MIVGLVFLLYKYNSTYSHIHHHMQIDVIFIYPTYLLIPLLIIKEFPLTQRLLCCADCVSSCILGKGRWFLIVGQYIPSVFCCCCCCCCCSFFSLSHQFLVIYFQNVLSSSKMCPTIFTCSK